MTTCTNSSKSHKLQEQSNISYLIDLAKFTMINQADFQHKIFEMLCFAFPLENMKSETSSDLLELITPPSQEN